jgi:hypothetical protein
MIASGQQTAFSRPGIRLILGAGPLLAVLYAVPSLASMHQSATGLWQHVMTSTGLLPGIGTILGALVLLIIYGIGCVRYACSKGYSKEIGFWLCLGHFPGFITLLVLPDRCVSSEHR